VACRLVTKNEIHAKKSEEDVCSPETDRQQPNTRADSSSELKMFDHNITFFTYLLKAEGTLLKHENV
jgi:hypothetical protein